MEIAELKKLAARTRSIREISTALLLGGALLALLYFAPLSSGQSARSAEATAPQPLPDAFASVPINAKAAIVYDLTTGQTLYAKNAEAQLPLASLTKLLTVYAALSVLPAGAPLTISAKVAGLPAPRALRSGETFALDDLARITLTASLNDGAASIAEAAAQQTGRSTNALLAGVAAALSLPQTYAVNGSGLDVNAALSGGYGSARDLAVLAGALVRKAPEVARATTESRARAVSAQGVTVTVRNTDPMTATLPGLLLSKTGSTELAGGNFAIVFDVGIGHPIAIVVLGSTDAARFTDGQALLAATLAHFAGLASL